MANCEKYSICGNQNSITCRDDVEASEHCGSYYSNGFGVAPVPSIEEGALQSKNSKLVVKENSAIWKG